MSIDLKIAGISPLSSQDFPGNWSAVLFLQGCPWRCHYCHNPHLWSFNTRSGIHWDTVRIFLTMRKNLLDAVVFSGGEPTMQKSLIQKLEEVKELGFKIGLHTGGAFPSRLKKIIPYIDWVGFDIKAPFSQYTNITQRQGAKQAFESANIILESGVDYEFRTTIHSCLLKDKDLLSLATSLKEMGVSRYVLQRFRTTGCQNTNLQTDNHAAYPDSVILQKLKEMFVYFAVR